jgi:hypothetical protein
VSIGPRNRRTDLSFITDDPNVRRRVKRVARVDAPYCWITVGLAALACAACCPIPFLIAAGVVTGVVTALLRNALLAIAAGLAVVALGIWWLHRRRNQQKAAGTGASGCGSAGCDC